MRRDAFILLALSLIGSAAAQTSGMGGSVAESDSKEIALRAGNYFVASTGTVTIANGSYLNVRVCNISSDKRLIITKRRFDNNAMYNVSPVGYGGIGSPVAIASPTINIMGTNLQVGGAASTVFQLTAAVSTARIDNAAGNAVPTGTGFLPLQGNVVKLEEWRIVPPSTCFANYIVGQMSGSGFAAISAGITVYGFTEPNT